MRLDAAELGENVDTTPRRRRPASRCSLPAVQDRKLCARVSDSLLQQRCRERCSSNRARRRGRVVLSSYRGEHRSPHEDIGSAVTGNLIPERLRRIWPAGEHDQLQGVIMLPNCQPVPVQSRPVPCGSTSRYQPPARVASHTKPALDNAPSLGRGRGSTGNGRNLSMTRPSCRLTPPRQAGGTTRVVQPAVEVAGPCPWTSNWVPLLLLRPPLCHCRGRSTAQGTSPAQAGAWVMGLGRRGQATADHAAYRGGGRAVATASLGWWWQARSLQGASTLPDQACSRPSREVWVLARPLWHTVRAEPGAW